MSSRMGNTVTVEVFGESHARAIGMTLEGIPAGVRIDEEKLQAFMARRAPGRDATATARREADIPQFLCGVLNGVTTGAPITAIIENTNTRSADYSALCTRPRPSHADYVAYVKYGGHNDLRGGGHFSGRLTAPLCIAGGIALQMLEARGITVGAHVSRIAGIADTPYDAENLTAAALRAAAGDAFAALLLLAFMMHNNVYKRGCKQNGHRYHYIQQRIARAAGRGSFRLRRGGRFGGFGRCGFGGCACVDHRARRHNGVALHGAVLHAVCIKANFPLRIAGIKQIYFALCVARYPCAVLRFVYGQRGFAEPLRRAHALIRLKYYIGF